MSFTSILHTILGVGHVGLQIAGVALPQFDGVLTIADNFVLRLENGVKTAEVAITTTKAGADKSAAVIADFEAGLELANTGLALEGKMLDYDRGLLQESISAFSLAYTKAAALKASVHVVPIPKLGSGSSNTSSS